MKGSLDALRVVWEYTKATPAIVLFLVAWLFSGLVDMVFNTHFNYLVVVAAAAHAFKDHFEFVAPWWDDQAKLWHRLRHRANADGWTRVARLYEGERDDGGTAVNVYVRMREKPRKATAGVESGFVTLDVVMRRGTESGYYGEGCLDVTIGVASGRGEFLFPENALVEAKAFRIDIDVNGPEAIFHNIPKMGPRGEAARARDEDARAQGRKREAARQPDGFVADTAPARTMAAILKRFDLKTNEGRRNAKRTIAKRFAAEACGASGADAVASEALARANNHIAGHEKRARYEADLAAQARKETQAA